MPAASKTQKYVVTISPFAGNQEKGMWIWKQTKAATKADEPEGDQVYVPAGSIVELTPEAAQPFLDTGRLRPAAEA